MSDLSTKAWLGQIILAGVMGLLLFGPAGTLQYWQAWAYLGVFFGPSSLITLYLLKKDPALLRRRLRGGPNLRCTPVHNGANRIRKAAHSKPR